MLDLPQNPGPANVTFSLIDYGRVITGPLGGADVRVDRAGTRFKLSVNMPAMNTARGAQKYISRLMRGKSEGCRLSLPLGDFKPGTPGLPVVAVDDPQGDTLSMSGFAPSYIIREGQFFSVEHSGQHFVYTAAEDAVCAADGTVELNIYPPLRASYSIGDRCHFLEPKIEGFIEGNEMMWNLAVDQNTSFNYAIRERE